MQNVTEQDYRVSLARYLNIEVVGAVAARYPGPFQARRTPLGFEFLQTATGKNKWGAHEYANRKLRLSVPREYVQNLESELDFTYVQPLNVLLLPESIAVTLPETLPPPKFGGRAPKNPNYRPRRSRSKRKTPPPGIQPEAQHIAPAERPTADQYVAQLQDPGVGLRQVVDALNWYKREAGPAMQITLSQDGYITVTERMGA